MSSKKDVKLKIAVGVSGGVDSAVAALLSKEAGHEVVGVTMRTWDDEYLATRGDLKGGACFIPDGGARLRDAAKVCGHLGIPLTEVDCATTFTNEILKNFNDEYMAGRTPNPCVICNRFVKFGAFPQLAAAAGVEFDVFATGHYCRVEYDEVAKGPVLKKGLDAFKDQSYFLYRLVREQLRRIRFPLGNLTKKEVRKIAMDANIPVHSKKESQDFYNGHYGDLLDSGDRPKTGRFINPDGETIGEHKGFWNYTIGQRKGLGVAHTAPLYVAELRPKTNEVVLAEREALLSKTLTADSLNFFFDDLPERAEAKIRSSPETKNCSVELMAGGSELLVEFDEPCFAVTPGQSVVLYDGDTVLGGGIISG
ncbi:MAG: tRNA 2-thiouridine(34) synthase MnmA [Kiritimatiellaeota bacterium]|nr:tRNA 2-thiouridine(34) synthase MnmA [Kiritimatiellota bacterium]